VFFKRREAKLRTSASFVSRRQWAIGVVVIALGLGLHFAGMLGTLEYFFDDLRAQYFGFNSPEPSEIGRASCRERV